MKKWPLSKAACLAGAERNWWILHDQYGQCSGYRSWRDFTDDEKEHEALQFAERLRPALEVWEPNETQLDEYRWHAPADHELWGINLDDAADCLKIVVLTETEE